VLLKEPGQILRAEHALLRTVQCGTDSFMGLFDAIGSRNSEVVCWHWHGLLLLIDIGIYTNVYPRLFVAIDGGAVFT